MNFEYIIHYKYIKYIIIVTDEFLFLIFGEILKAIHKTQNL